MKDQFIRLRAVECTLIVLKFKKLTNNLTIQPAQEITVLQISNQCTARNVHYHQCLNHLAQEVDNSVMKPCWFCFKIEVILHP